MFSFDVIIAQLFNQCFSDFSYSRSSPQEIVMSRSYSSELLIFVCLSILNCTNIANATAFIDLPIVVVTPVLFESPDTFSNNAMINRQQLEAGKATDIIAPLYGSSSINLMQSKSSGTTSITLRGVSGGQGLVTFDGVPLFANLAGFYSLRNFPSDAVETIQINRGFNQTINNSRTLGGSINLQSRQVRDGVMKLSAEVGNDETLNASIASGWGGIDNVTFVVGRTLISEGDSQSSTYTADADDDNYRMNRVLLRANKEFNRGHIDASLYYINVNEDTDGPGLTPEFKAAWLDDSNGWFSDEVLISQVKAELVLSDNWQSSVQLAYTQDRQDGEVGTFRPILPIGPFSMNLSSQLALVDWQNQHFFQFDNKLKLDMQWGVSSQRQWADTSQNNLHESHTLLSPNIGVSFSRNNWNINLSSRLDDNNIYGSHGLYSIGTQWQFSSNMSFWANYGRNFRAPGVNERLHPIYGNQSLKAEHNTGGEIGLQWLNDDLAITFSTYQHNTHDLVVLALNSNTGATSADNVSDVKTQGIEIAIEKKWSTAWQSNLNYTYMDANNSQTHQTVAIRPEHRLNLATTWQITRPLSLRVEVSGHDGFWHDAGNSLWSGSVVKINSVMTYQLNDTSEIYLRADNITDDDAIEIYGFDYPHRSIYLGGNIVF